MDKNNTSSSIPSTSFYIKGTAVVNNTTNLEPIKEVKIKANYKGYSNISNAYGGQDFDKCFALLTTKNGKELILG